MEYGYWGGLVLIGLLIFLLLFSVWGITMILFPFNTLVTLSTPKKVFYTQPEKVQIFPSSQKLEANWELIRDEGLSLMKNSNPSTNSFRPFDLNRKLLDSFWEGWTTIPLRFFGKDNSKNLSKCPKLASLLSSDPTILSAFFSIMAPGKKLAPHCGPYKGILRYHLGLKIPPEDCFITVDHTKYIWTPGEGILFDETYEHAVENNTKEYRMILFLDIKRPLPWLLDVANQLHLGIMGIFPHSI